jgi:hypothetical protein
MDLSDNQKKFATAAMGVITMGTVVAAPGTLLPYVAAAVSGVAFGSYTKEEGVLPYKNKEYWKHFGIWTASFLASGMLSGAFSSATTEQIQEDSLEDNARTSLIIEDNVVKSPVAIDFKV